MQVRHVVNIKTRNIKMFITNHQKDYFDCSQKELHTTIEFPL